LDLFLRPADMVVGSGAPFCEGVGGGADGMKADERPVVCEEANESGILPSSAT
jgi:hypothetical protein